jgi:hypothetical protein
MIAAAEQQARLDGAEEIYVAAAADLARDLRFMRIEGEAASGKSFALRATVAYKGTWVRLVRTFCDADVEHKALAQFAQAVAQLPSDRGFAGLTSWVVEGCRTTQPLEPLMGSRFGVAIRPSSGALVSVQGIVMIVGHAVLVGAPALLGAQGEAASVLINPSW